jgi:lysophospholipase L1-like esterase
MGRYYEPDGVHLNAAGYALWAGVLAGVVGLATDAAS